jgi:hypothetical protein
VVKAEAAALAILADGHPLRGDWPTDPAAGYSAVGLWRAGDIAAVAVARGIGDDRVLCDIAPFSYSDGWWLATRRACFSVRSER